MSATERQTRQQEHRHQVDRTAGPLGGEEQEDLPPAKYRDPRASTIDPVAAREEQVREMDTASATVGPTAGVMTDAQGRGAMLGTVVGAAFGVALMLGAALVVPIADLDLGVRLLIFGIVGAFAGGTAGAVYGGGRAPELEGEATDADLDVPVDRRS